MNFEPFRNKYFFVDLIFKKGIFIHHQLDIDFKKMDYKKLTDTFVNSTSSAEKESALDTLVKGNLFFCYLI